MKKFTILEEDLIKENAQTEQIFKTNYQLALSHLEEVKNELDKLKIGFYDPDVKKSNEFYIKSIEYTNDLLDQILDHFMWNEHENN